MSLGADGVKCGSRCAMKDHVPAPNCAAQSYMFRREAPLGNTFINLCAQEEQLMRRSNSAPCFLRSAVEAPRVANPYKVNLGGSSVAANPNETVAASDLEACHDNGLEVQEAPSALFTTVMIRNLPVQTDKAGVRVALRDTGFH
eukprot:1773813-Amphidinium_carterae.1